MRNGKRAKRRLWFVCSLLVLVIAGGITVKAFRAQQKDRLVASARADGIAAYERGDLDNALEHLSYYVQHRKAEPEVIDALLKFADARRRVPLDNGRHLTEAAGLYQHARRFLDDYPGLSDHEALLVEANRRLLELYSVLGMHTELLETARRVLEDDPTDIEALAARVRVLYLQRDFEDAMETADLLITQQPDDIAWRHMKLQIMRGLKHPDEALLVQCDEWIADYRGDGRLFLLKAGWLAEIGRKAEAQSTAQLAADRGAQSLEVLQQMVSLLDLIELRDAATELLARAQSTFAGEQWVREATVERFWHAGYLEEALVTIGSAEEDFGSLESGLLRLKVMSLLSLDRFDEARQVLNTLHSAAADGESADADRAWAEAVSARLDVAKIGWGRVMDACQAALNERGDDAVLFCLLGEARFRIGDRALAVEAYERAFDIEPHWLAAGIGLADALMQAERPHEAFRISRLLVNRSPERRLPVFTLLARSYIASREAGGSPAFTDSITGRPVDVTGLISIMRDQYPDRFDLALLLAEAYCVTDRSRQAKEVIAELIADEKANSEALLSMVAISRKHALGEADRLIAAARRIDGAEIPSALAEANLLADRGRFDEGLDVIDAALARATADESDSLNARLGRCAYLLRMDLPDGASALGALVADYPLDVDVQYFALAQPALWESSSLAGRVIGNFKRIVGEDSPRLRLAEANALLRFKAGDESQRAKAMVVIGEVLEQSPDSMPALILMADASMSGSHPSIDRAITHLKRAVNIAPARGDLCARLIDLLQRRGDFEESGQYLQQLARLALRNPRLLENEMRLLHAQGDFEAALLRANRLVTEDSPANDQLLLAAMHLRAGRHDEAEEIYRRLLASGDSGELATVQAAEFYAKTGRFERGFQLLKSLDVDDPDSAGRSMMLGSFLQRHGRTAEAEQWLRRAANESPSSAEAHHQLARLYLSSSDYEGARRETLAGLKIDPEHTGLRATLAAMSMAFDRDDRREAVAQLREMGQENDALIATLILLDSIPVVDGTAVPTDKDLARVKKLVEAHPRFLPAWQLAITLHKQADRVREAIDSARRAVTRFPAQSEPAEWAVGLLVDCGRWDEALGEAHEWRSRTLDNPVPADLTIASILLELNRPADACAMIEPHSNQILADRAIAPDRLTLWLRALVFSGRIDDAWTCARPLMTEDPFWPSTWLGLASLVEFETAESILARFETIVSDLPATASLQLAQAHNSLGRRFGNPKSFERAASILAAAPDEPKLRISARFLQARIFEGKGELDQAARCYKDVLNEQPDNPWVLNNLAAVLAESPDRLEESLDFAERAVELEPNQPDLLETLAGVLHASGRAADARQALDQAIALRPGDITLRLSMAEFLMRTGKYGEAEANLKIVRSTFDGSGPPNPALDTRIQALERLLNEAHAAVNP